MTSDITTAPPVSAVERSLRILLIEDDAMLGMLLTGMLEAFGHSVCAVAVTEQDAVAAADLHHPDLILADVSLAQGSGIKALVRILDVRPAPHIYMSGNAAKLGALGPAAVVLEKPFAEPDVRRAITRALELAAVP
jgi:CheY-like chemotaxis protein